MIVGWIPVNFQLPDNVHAGSGSWVLLEQLNAGLKCDKGQWSDSLGRQSCDWSHWPQWPIIFCFLILFFSPVPYTRGTVYSGAAPARSVVASDYGRNVYVWSGSNVLVYTLQWSLYINDSGQNVHWWKDCIYNHHIKCIFCKKTKNTKMKGSKFYSL